MEKELSNAEERLLELLEFKNFDALTTEERHFVLSHFSQETYDFQRSIIVEASENTLSIPTVKPLILPQKPKKGLMIPLYQALIAVAAVIVFFVLIWPSNSVQTKIVYRETATKPTTVFKVVHDTIYFVEKGLQTATIIYDTVLSTRIENNSLPSETRLLEAQNSFQLPELTSDLFKVNSLSMKEEASLNAPNNLIFSIMDK